MLLGKPEVMGIPVSSVAMMEHSDQKQLMEGKVYLIYTSMSQSIIEGS